MVVSISGAIIAIAISTYSIDTPISFESHQAAVSITIQRQGAAPFACLPFESCQKWCSHIFSS
jgi:hypothetical protein